MLLLPVSVAEKVGVMPATGLLKASLKVTLTVEVATLSATTGPVPVMFEFAATGVPAVNTTLPSALVTGAVIESVFDSARSEVIEQLETPEVFVAEQAA